MNPRIQTFVRPEGRGYAVASIRVSVLSSKLPLSFIVLPFPLRLVLRGTLPTKSAAGAIRGMRVREGKKDDVGKRSEVRQTETNSRKQGLKETERTRKERLVKRVRT